MASSSKNSATFERVGHFLEPTLDPSDQTQPNISVNSHNNLTNHHLASIPLSFVGWQLSDQKWNDWYDRMRVAHEHTWREVGIAEAIRSCTFRIYRHTDVILALAKKWSPWTNTFVLKWGEATVTLEDVCVLGGYSVMGEPVRTPPNADGIEAVDARLVAARQAVIDTPAKKVTHSGWVRLFTTEGGNGFADVEHEAFLVYWLSKFVFPEGAYVLGRHVHNLAIRLAQGTKIALAPAILASLYQDLTALRNAFSSPGPITSSTPPIKLYSPLHLVQIWAWERFSLANPITNNIIQGQMILARWKKVRPVINGLEVIEERLEDEAKGFVWRPYASYHNIHEITRITYPDDEQILTDLDQLEPEIEAYIRFQRAGQLVGLHCIEQYQPNRVARQFGFDQDIPGDADRSNRDSDVAFENYNRPLIDPKLLIPARESEGQNTARYKDWWNRSRAGSEAGSSSAGRN